LARYGASGSISRSLAALEALAGNLFLAVLVACLVGLVIDWRHEQRERRRQDEESARPAEPD